MRIIEKMNVKSMFTCIIVLSGVLSQSFVANAASWSGEPNVQDFSNSNNNNTVQSLFLRTGYINTPNGAKAHRETQVIFKPGVHPQNCKINFTFNTGSSNSFSIEESKITTRTDGSGSKEYYASYTTENIYQPGDSVYSSDIIYPVTNADVDCNTGESGSFLIEKE